MMIEDEELRTLYKVASEDHIQKIEAGLLNLEKHPEDHTPLEELLREAHSLKGDSRMLGVKDVETLIHQMEHTFGAVKRKETTLTQVMCDRLWVGLDAIRKLVNSAVTEEESGINTFQVLAQLMGAETQAPPVNQNPPISEEKIAKNSPVKTPETIIPEIEAIAPVPIPIEKPKIKETAYPTDIPTAITPTSIITKKPETKIVNNNSTAQPQTQNINNYKIETIRVETKYLDTLMTQAGELTVTKIRIAHRLAEIEEIVSLWEEWSRDTFINRVQDIKDKDTEQKIQTANSSLVNFHHRTEESVEKLGNLVNGLRNAVYEDTARLDTIANDLESGIRTLRLLPLSTIFQLFPRMVRDLAKQQEKEIELIIEGGETTADKRILEEMKDPLMHMIRNCIDHGIETPAERQQMGKQPQAKLWLRGFQTSTNIIIEVQDNGRGLDLHKIKQTALKRGICREEELATMSSSQIYALIFTPGFSTRTVVTEVSGRGVGLDVVRTNVERLKGNIQVESESGKGCTFRIQLGMTLATAHVLIVEVENCAYAIPVEFVQTTRLVPESDIFAIEGRETIVWDTHPISVARLSDLLELSTVKLHDNQANNQMPCIILKIGEERLGLFVDALLDEQDVILKPQSQLLKRVRNISGATILGTGEVCMVLNPADLIKSVRMKGGQISVSSPRTESKSGVLTSNSVVKEVKEKLLILLVEDSIATRTQEKRILEGAGYEVVTAVDGLDGFNKLKTRSFDAVVSDVQMPNMDGLSLAAKIRQIKEYNELPIILVTSLSSDEDKKKGAEAGANAYIPKGSFNQEVLLETLKRLV